MVDLETATIQLYEDASLTEDLQDEEAKLLLKWGETQLKPLVEKHAEDEEGFEGSFKNVRRFIKSVNHFVGRRQDSAPDEQQEMLAKVVEAAQSINPNFGTDAVNAFTQAQTAQSNTQLIESLLAQISPSSPETSPLAPAPSASPVSSSPLLTPATSDNNNKQDKEDKPQDEEDKPDIKPFW